MILDFDSKVSLAAYRVVVEASAIRCCATAILLELTTTSIHSGLRLQRRCVSASQKSECLNLVWLAAYSSLHNVAAGEADYRASGTGTWPDTRPPGVAACPKSSCVPGWEG